MIEYMPGIGGAVAAFVLGALFGSFANVCIYRWPPTDEHPRGRSCVKPPSHCFSCGENIKWYDNIPLLSFLWLRGACRFCKATFSARYLWVELIAALLFLLMHVVAFHWRGMNAEQGTVYFAIMCTFMFVLVVVTFIDLDHRIIPDMITKPSVPIFLALGTLTYAAPLIDRLVGIAVGYGIVWLLDTVWLHVLKRGMGMGLGDAKLLAVIGALLGWTGVVSSLFFGALLGVAIGLPLAAIYRQRSAEPSESLGKTAIPFGPFLALGAVVYIGLLAAKPELLSYWLHPDWTLQHDPFDVSLPDLF